MAKKLIMGVNGATFIPVLKNDATGLELAATPAVLLNIMTTTMTIEQKTITVQDCWEKDSSELNTGLTGEVVISKADLAELAQLNGYTTTDGVTKVKTTSLAIPVQLRYTRLMGDGTLMGVTIPVCKLVLTELSEKAMGDDAEASTLKLKFTGIVSVKDSDIIVYTDVVADKDLFLGITVA